MSDIIGSLDQIQTTYTLVTTVFEDLFKMVEAVKARKLSYANLLRAYYLEVINNIEFLSVINFSKLKNEKPNSKYIKVLLDNIDIQIGATILFENDIEKTSDLYRFLENKGKINNRKNMIVKNNNGLEEKVKGKMFYENVLQAISFTVVKTQILQRMVRLSDDDMSILNTILLEKRVMNLYERFIMIKSKLDELDILKSIAR